MDFLSRRRCADWLVVRGRGFLNRTQVIFDIFVNYFVTMSGIAASASAGPAVAPKGRDKMEPRLQGLMQTHGVSGENMDKLGNARVVSISILNCVAIGRT